MLGAVIAQIAALVVATVQHVPDTVADASQKVSLLRRLHSADFIEGSRFPERLLYRAYGAEDVASAVMGAAASGPRGVHCAAQGWAMVVLCGAHLGYVAALRPHAEFADQACAVATAVLVAAVTGTAVFAPRTADWDDRYATLAVVATAWQYAQLLVLLGAWAMATCDGNVVSTCRREAPPIDAAPTPKLRATLLAPLLLPAAAAVTPSKPFDPRGAVRVVVVQNPLVPSQS